MKNGSIVLVSFTAKEKDTNRILETTYEDIAKKSSIYDDKALYRPLPVVVGSGELLKGLDEALKEMNVGEEKEIVLPPEKAFGQRNPELIRVVPLQEFKARNLTPVPGMVVDINGLLGRVQSVSGGRVRVDFNHELAGKTLIYKIKIEKQLTKPEEICKEFFCKYFAAKEAPHIEAKDNIVTIKTDNKKYMQNFAAKESLARTLLKYVDSIKKLEFVEEYNATNTKLD